ncbi:hypothetical protein GDO81_027483 [Engystomops pustulosus]|uniref:Uncharacterized protein n=1 Tax=Engystomops pustulosus TaxID=76066 RepID=A0AAV6YIG3_ENGPU|nr:hypothetical protein GDO81_027483 [Engystomops pustulosus]
MADDPAASHRVCVLLDFFFSLFSQQCQLQRYGKKCPSSPEPSPPAEERVGLWTGACRTSGAESALRYFVLCRVCGNGEDLTCEAADTGIRNVLPQMANISAIKNFFFFWLVLHWSL